MVARSPRKMAAMTPKENGTFSWDLLFFQFYSVLELYSRLRDNAMNLYGCSLVIFPIQITQGEKHFFDSAYNICKIRTDVLAFGNKCVVLVTSFCEILLKKKRAIVVFNSFGKLCFFYPFNLSKNLKLQCCP